jgi:hypothetical protein
MKRVTTTALIFGTAALLSAGCDRSQGADLHARGTQGTVTPLTVRVTSARPGVQAQFTVLNVHGGVELRSAPSVRRNDERIETSTPAEFTVGSPEATFRATFHAAAGGPPLQVDVYRGVPRRLTAQGRAVTVQRSSADESVEVIAGPAPTRS